MRITGAHPGRVGVLLGSELIDLHTQQVGAGRHVTKIEHMPIHHQRFRDPKLHLRAEGIGPQVRIDFAALVKRGKARASGF